MKTKALVIILFFIVALTGLIVLREMTATPIAIHGLDMFDKGSDWIGFRFENMYAQSDSDKFAAADRYAGLYSPIISADFPFDEIVLTWNCRCDTDAGLAVIIGIGDKEEIKHRFFYQCWGAFPESLITAMKNQYPDSIHGIGKVDIDILKLNRKYTNYSFDFHSFNGGTYPYMVDLVTICYTNTFAGPSLAARHDPRISPISPIVMSVPFFAQGTLPDSISSRTCSPTSLAMVLNYHGLDYNHLETSLAVYDPLHEIYGNWPYNIQAAYNLGMAKAWLARHNSFGEIYPEIAAGNPVIISIDVPPGKLKGAPYNSTGGGHLIVVRGFDDKGNVLVNDPAGDNPQEGLAAYDIDELTRVWVAHGGVAYHLWSEK